jgi:hypothetical protein
MSDIFIKGGDGNWKKAIKIFVKAASGWQQAVNIFIKANVTDWLRVWPFSGIYSTRAAWIGTASNTAYADRLTSSSYVRIGSNYFGNNAQWNPNGWAINSYTYRWKYYNEFNAEQGTLESGTGASWTSGGTGQDELPTSIWTSTNSTNTDRMFLGFEVTANATNSINSGTSVSTRVRIIRRNPINLTYSLSTYTPKKGQQITYSSTWDTTEAYKAESVRTTIYWYSNTTNSTSGGTYLGSGSTYTPVQNDIGKYLYVVESRFNSGTDYSVEPIKTTGVQASVITTSTVADTVAPGAFSISSVTKAFPVNSSQGSVRTVAFSWGAATNAATYSWFIEKSNDNSTWSTANNGSGVAQTYANTSTTSTSVSTPIEYALYYRVSLRATSSDNVTTNASNNPFSATGTDPGDPTSLGLSSRTSTSLSISYTATTSPGSNTLAGIQYKIGSGGTWSSTTTDNPVNITNLSANTSYTIYLRSVNNDGLVSTGSASTTQSTLAPFTAGTISVSGGSTTTADGYVSSGATLTLSTSGWPAGTTFSYQWKRTSGGQAAVQNAGTANTQSVSTTNVGEYFWCVVTYSNSTYNISNQTTTSYYYTVVPAKPSYTLTGGVNNFVVSSVTSSEGTHYFGSYSGSSSGNISRTSSASTTVSSITAGTVTVRLYSSVQKTIGGTLVWLDSWEYTDQNVTVTNAPNYQATGSQRRIALPSNSNISNGTLIYISTNGYINWGNATYSTVDPTTTISVDGVTQGLTLSILNGDLRQTELYTYATSTSFVVRWKGAQYNDATQTVDYQATLWFGQPYADVYFVTNNLTTAPSTVAFKINNSNQKFWSDSTLLTQSLVNTSLMTRNTTKDTIDDGTTALYAQYVASPFFPPYFPPFFPPFFPPHFPPFFPPYFPPFFPPFFPPHFPPFFPPYFPPFFPPFFPPYFPPFFPPYFASTPSTPSAPTVQYKSAQGGYNYTWNISYTLPGTATSMDVMEQYFSSSSGTYTSSPWDVDPPNYSISSSYSGYIGYRNFPSSKALPLTYADGYWDNNYSWMRARVRARNSSGVSAWSAWSAWA